MGKKSLLKSTSKKKSAKAKTDAEKELKGKTKASGEKKAADKPTAEKKSKPKSMATKAKPAKTTSKAKALKTKTAKAKSTKSAAKSAPPQKKPTLKALLGKTFERAVPENRYTPPTTPVSASPSPPFVSGLDAAETDRVRKLLFKTFDLSTPDPEPEPEAVVPEPEPAAAEPAPEVQLEPKPEPEPEPEPETPPVPVSELLKRTFERVPPAQLYTPPAAPVSASPSPPFVSGLDAAETDRVRKLLFKTFDLSSVEPEPEEPEAPAAEPEGAKPKPAVSRPIVPPKEPKKPMDPMLKTLISAGSCLAAIFFLIIVASISNMTKYYVTQKHGALVIRQGRFAPMGTERIAILPGAKMPVPQEPFYTRDEVGPLIVKNYLRRADAILTAKGTPDFNAARALFTGALPYASASEIRTRLQSRLDRIDMSVLVLKADINAASGTPDGLKAAADLLNQALPLAEQASDKAMIQAKLTALSNGQVPPKPAEESPAPVVAPSAGKEALSPAPPAVQETPAATGAGESPTAAPAETSTDHS